MKTRTPLSFLSVIVWLSFLVGPASAAPQAAVIFVDSSTPDGLAAYWKFDDAGSPIALDFVGANPMTLQNAAAQTAASVAPLHGPNPGSLALNGTNQYAQVDSFDAALAVSTSFSLAGWVRRTSKDTYDAIYDSGSQPNKWWVFIADGSAGKVNQLGFGKRGISEFYSTQAITDTNWHHIAVVKNGNSGTNLTFYVDGVASGTAAVGPVTTPGGSARIGALLDGNIAAQFDGAIDDLRLYNRALTAAEVSRLSLGSACVSDGTSWATAYRELQCALSAAVAGNEIWLKAGFYRPGVSRSVSFQLVDGVKLLGGFAGTETLASERPSFNPNSPQTILSGDIAQDDSPPFTNNVENSQHVVLVTAGVTSAMDSLAVEGGNASPLLSGGGIAITGSSGNLTLSQVVIRRNSAASGGGGIQANGPLTLTGVSFSDNATTAGSGGGLSNSAIVTATSLDFKNNTALNGSGGALFATSILILDGATFQSNQASNGGALAVSSAADLNHLTFTSNHATTSGGAALTSGAISIKNSTFTSNTSQNGGGIINLSSLGLNNVQFTGNSATQQGGAIFNQGSLAGTGGVFNLNQASSGGAVSFGGPTPPVGHGTFTGTIFTANTANGDGGAILAGDGITLTNVTISGNIANGAGSRGGGLFGLGSVTLDTVLFSANQTGRFGGGAYLANGHVHGSTFLNNSAGSEGGALLLTSSSDVDATRFSGNTSSLSGGISSQGPIDRSQVLSVTNSLFVDNQANSPAGAQDMRLFDLTITLVNNTFGRPKTTGISVASLRTNLTAQNNIWVGYDFSLSDNDLTHPSLITEDYNLRFNAPFGATITPGVHDLTANPLFADPAGLDFSLMDGSPAIDAGNNSALPPKISTDLNGAPRFADRFPAPNVGSGDPPVDLGALELPGNIHSIFLPAVEK